MYSSNGHFDNKINCVRRKFYIVYYHNECKSWILKVIGFILFPNYSVTWKITTCIYLRILYFSGQYIVILKIQ